MKKDKFIIVEVSGGNVTSVYSNDLDIKVDIMDWDNAEQDKEYKKICDRLKRMTKRLHAVY